MALIADLHLHSRYSRATSPRMELKSLAQTAAKKGIDIVGSGDFTHPEWFSYLKENLVPAEPGLFKLKDGKDNKVRFILSCEVSCIYSKGGRVRKVHHIILAPSLESAEKINKKLALYGNLAADGRPIFGADSLAILKIVLHADPSCLFIPAHAWTPWFAIFGSKSGFNSIQECFGDYSTYIYAVETGLSSDPAMNWRLSALDKITLVSFSDAHSPEKLGREATVFNTAPDFYEIVKAIKTKDPEKILYTIEFFPQEGKYHYDGHRLCGLSFSPSESKENNNLCPRCGRVLTIGVLSRVEELADRPEGVKPQNAIPYKSIVPLQEIIAEVLKQGVGS
ncbi:MAG: endonuclease Q family protein, partial [Candidatus Paceibacteria bacterium]